MVRRYSCSDRSNGRKDNLSSYHDAERRVVLRVAERAEHEVHERRAEEPHGHDARGIDAVADVAEPQHADGVAAQKRGVQVRQLVLREPILGFQARLAAGERLARDVQAAVAPEGEDEDAHAGREHSHACPDEPPNNSCRFCRTTP